MDAVHSPGLAEILTWEPGGQDVAIGEFFEARYVSEIFDAWQPALQYSFSEVIDLGNRNRLESGRGKPDFDPANS
jgi:hypothetical protein